MLALEGYPLGLRFRFLEPTREPPVNGLGEVVRASFGDHDALKRFAEGLDVVTYEFENVPLPAVQVLSGCTLLRPPTRALEVAQDRVLEKRAFEKLGIPTASWFVVDGRDELDTAVAHLGLPALLKTRRMGYDGKGQAVIRSLDECEHVWRRFEGKPLILERHVAFQRELSVLGVRSGSGEIRFYPLVENDHRQGILRVARAPAASLDATLGDKAQGYARSLMEALDYVGVLALELFQEDGELLANEMAPRVHNSGHWTLDGARCSQFENHLRAVCGFRLGSTDARDYSAMVNLIGRLPPLERLLEVPGARVHLYDKRERAGRKLGHVNLTGANEAQVDALLEQLAAVIGPGD